MRVELAVCCILAAMFVTWGVTVLWMRHRQLKKIGEYQDEVLKKQREEVRNIYETMRGWRHDYHNHMQMMKAYMSMDQAEEMVDYLDHLEEDLDGIDMAVRTGNVCADAILSSKISMAEKQDIQVDCTAKIPAALTVSDVDLCAVLGNLLDNAIESCVKVKESGRFMRIYIGIFKKQLYISVSNATCEKRRKYLTEFVTQKQGEHGFGLRRIDRIAEKYDGYVNRKNEPGVFATEVMFPL